MIIDEYESNIMAFTAALKEILRLSDENKRLKELSAEIELPAERLELLESTDKLSPLSPAARAASARRASVR